MFKIIENKDKRFCKAYRCKNRRPDKDVFCPKHRKRYQKEAHPVEYYFSLLRSNAQRRGKPFSLTVDEFRGFCEKTGYLDKKGKRSNSASIDRIDATKGYQIDNIQVITLSENSRKGNSEAPF